MPKTRLPKQRGSKTTGAYSYKIINGKYYLKGETSRQMGKMLKKGQILNSDDPELHKKLPNKLKPLNQEVEEDEEDEIDDEESVSEKKTKKLKAARAKAKKETKKAKPKKSKKKDDDEDEDDED